MIRILLVEDDSDEANALEGALSHSGDLAVDRAADAAAARSALADGEHDIIVLDLAIPADSRKLAPRRDEGERLVTDVLRDHPGTVLYVLSGHADLHLASQFSNLAGSEDLFGDRVDERMLRFFPKEDLIGCVDALNEHIGRLVELDSVSLDTPVSGLSLTVSEERALRILTRRSGGAVAHVAALAGGLSSAKTVQLEAQDSEKARTALLAVKLGSLARVVDEAERYANVVGLMPPGLGAHLTTTVKAGAGDMGAVGYRLADDYDRSLFAALADDTESAAIAARLADRFAEWYTGAAEITETVRDIRRRLISDAEVMSALSPSERGALAAVETVSVRSGNCMQHGDLHGLNVLVDSRGEPVVIDYGDVGRANPAVDPVTLELSAIFHPDAPDTGWPTEDDLDHFDDDVRYLSACPNPEFVRACRHWSAAAQRSPEERAATVLAYAVRQLRYSNPTAPLARRLIEVMAARLSR